MREKYLKRNTMVLTEDGWQPAVFFEFVYPLWIRVVPIKSLRRRLEKWYWEHGGEEAKS